MLELGRHLRLVLLLGNDRLVPHDVVAPLEIQRVHAAVWLRGGTWRPSRRRGIEYLAVLVEEENAVHIKGIEGADGPRLTERRIVRIGGRQGVAGLEEDKRHWRPDKAQVDMEVGIVLQHGRWRDNTVE